MSAALRLVAGDAWPRVFRRPGEAIWHGFAQEEPDEREEADRNRPANVIEFPRRPLGGNAGHGPNAKGAQTG